MVKEYDHYNKTTKYLQQKKDLDYQKMTDELYGMVLTERS